MRKLIPFTGLERHQRAIALLAPFALIALAVLGLTGVIGRPRSLNGLHLVPALLATLAALLTAPPPGEGLHGREGALPFAASGALGLLASIVASLKYEAPLAVSGAHFYREWTAAQAEFAPSALLCGLLFYAVVPVPLLALRARCGQLEWQAAGGLSTGLLATIALGGERLLEGETGVLMGASAFVILAAGSYLADRWVQRGRLESAPRTLLLGLTALALVTACLTAVAVKAAAHAAIRGVVQRTSPEVETALRDCAARLNATEPERLPQSLGELEGVDPDLAAGLLDGYAIRFASYKGKWILAADPLARIGERHVHYVVSSDDLELRAESEPAPLNLP